MIKYKNVVIHKFQIIDGIQLMRDSFFYDLFDKIMDEGAINNFFSLAKEEDLNADEFKNWCKFNYFYYVEYKEKPGGFVIIKELGPDIGMLDFYCFKEQWGTGNAEIIRYDTTEWLLKHDWLSLIWFIPMINKHMVNTLHKIKESKLGIMKKSRINKKNGELVDLLVGYANREMYSEDDR